MAKGRAITRFVECLSLCEERGGNVSEALRFLLDYVSTRERPTDWGLLEEGLVCNTHGVLFRDDPSFSDKTPAGRVSDKQRYSVKPDGSLRFYPVPEDMELALGSVLDRYNRMFEDCRGSYGISLFQTCAWLFCNFLELHPFADGNGRLCHILCSYVMSSYQPFPISVCKEKNYVATLVYAQDTGNLEPLVVCYCIIASNIKYQNTNRQQAKYLYRIKSRRLRQTRK